MTDETPATRTDPALGSEGDLAEGADPAATDRDVLGDLGLTEDPVSTDAPYLADDDA